MTKVEKILRRIEREKQESQKREDDYLHRRLAELDEALVKLQKLESQCDNGCGGGKRACTCRGTQDLLRHIYDEYSGTLLFWYLKTRLPTTPQV